MAETPTPAATHPHAGRKSKNKVLWTILGIAVALPVLAIVFILTFDWNRARPWINTRVSDAIDRPFAIRGNLEVEWESPAKSMAPAERSWRDHIPWPYLYANDVYVGNPASMPVRDMASVRQFSFSLNPFALLRKTIHIPLLRFDAPRVDLLRTDETHNNWTFKRNQEKSRWKLDLERVVLTDGVVHIKDAVTKADVTAFREYMEDLHGAVLEAIRAGQSLEEAQATIELDRYKDWEEYGDFLPLNIKGMYERVTLHRRGNP